ncbi:DUF397 domain-containing protein [Thermomonospora catenispora]|uniref:DUF397 domain-containing protein n=1 Tax=Thermomonospora catenispora TaxID=2493090 RepID=UPI001120D4B0|nr:DUF397 domain-containing protein [Thermomonospora catenispora]TNY38704.1 DUF397 domain-containing protein [Thermomonospora catenispora]
MSDMLPLRWRRSTYCGPDQINCVELAVALNSGRAERRDGVHNGVGCGGRRESAVTGGVLAVRDGKDPRGPVLLLDRRAAAELLASIKTGEHDV